MSIEGLRMSTVLLRALQAMGYRKYADTTYAKPFGNSICLVHTATNRWQNVFWGADDKAHAWSSATLEGLDHAALVNELQRHEANVDPSRGWPHDHSFLTLVEELELTGE